MSSAQQERNYEVIETPGVPVKAWIRGVPLEQAARVQLLNVARLPFIHKWVAVMPDVHLGKGSTIGTVIPTTTAIIPAAVGVDIGCGMMAVQTTLRAQDLPDNLTSVRRAIEEAVPHGRTHDGGRNDRGAWGNPPARQVRIWQELSPEFERLADKHPKIAKSNHLSHLGTLGTGNHFIEVCLDERDAVWLMLHSGSRGVGNRIGSYFIERAKEEMKRWHVHLPDQDLAYLAEGSDQFKDYVSAVDWAQRYAMVNRELMMTAVIDALTRAGLPPFRADAMVVNCHHNYVAQERHYGVDVYITRKGAVRARKGDLGIIPGSMGSRSFIVRGRGQRESFYSCSHGAGRLMSRGEAKRRFSVADHVRATSGIECRKDAAVVDETPMAYKSIDDVMRAQEDLVEIVHTLRQVVCVKG
jgi:tRNA-splicing ligase RtcB